MYLKQGTLLKHGEYRIERELGHGGFGITYLATQLGLNRKVAIKEFFMSEYCERDAATSQVSLGTSGSRDTVERFKNKFIKEAQNIAGLKHPHIISIHDVFEDNGTAYYVMEYLDHGSLADVVKRQGRLSEDDALRYIHQIADALRYIHERKMNHLDVKPGNILIDETDHAVLIDFGLSKRYDDEGNQTSTTPVGISHGYAPLEQYKKSGVGTFSPATDIYSLGATLYKLVTGTTPPDANDVNDDGLPSFPAYVSATMAKTIEQAMQPRRKDRPQSVEEFMALLEAEVKEEDEDTDLKINDNEDDSANNRGNGHKGKSGSSLKMKELLWPVGVFVAITLGFWGVRLYNEYCDKRQAYIQAYNAAKRDMTKFSVTTTPSGATVYIDGGIVGVTPIEDKEIAHGSHKVKLGKEGYQEKIFTRTFGDKPVVLNETLVETPKAQAQAQSSSSSTVATTGEINGHEYVDLGLSVKWATCNVGASSPSGYGNYYAWGETSTKSEYTAASSKTNGKSMSSIAGNATYDAARANWGGTWRMPTLEEIKELRKKCTWTWTTQGGHNGYRVTGPNGKSIFLPAAGYMKDASLYVAGSIGNYWSATHDYTTTRAWGLGLKSDNCWGFQDNRFTGRTVRPVSD